MTERFHIVQLDGYTDGRPSWVKIDRRNFISRPAADQAVKEYLAIKPERTLRIRKRKRRA